MKRNLSHGIGWLATVGFVVTVLASLAAGQVLPKSRAPGKQATPTAPAAAPAAPTLAPVAPGPVTPATGEAAGQARREGRQDTPQNIQATRAADLGVWFNGRTNNGLVISDLTNNSVFASAGFREGDQLVSINGQPIASEGQFVQYLTGPNLGTQPVQIIVVSNGQQQTLTLQPTALTQGIVNYDPLYQYGIVIDDSNPNQIVVQRVYARTPAYYAGLRQGDLITTFGGQRIANLNAFIQGLSHANTAIPLQITRSGQARNIQLDPVGISESSERAALRPTFDAGREAVPVRTPDSDTAPARIPDSATVPPRTPDSGPTTVAPALPATPPTSATPAVPRVTPGNPGTPTIPIPSVQPGTSGGVVPSPAAPTVPPVGTSGAGVSGASGTGTPR